MKHLALGFYILFTVILMFIPLNSFIIVQRGLKLEESDVSKREEIRARFDKRNTDLQNELLRLDSMKHKDLDSRKSFYDRQLEDLHNSIENNEWDRSRYEQFIKRWIRDKNEILRYKIASFYYYMYCVILVFTTSLIGYKFYFDKQFIYNDELGAQVFFNFLNILLDAILLSITIHLSNYSQINVFAGYLIFTLAFILKQLYFINHYHILSFISNNKKTAKVFIVLFNIAEVIVLFYLALSEPWAPFN